VYYSNFNINNSAYLSSENRNLINNNETPLNSQIHMRFYNYPQFSNFIQIQSIGYLLYTNNSFWLLLTSVILLLAMIGPITLSISKKIIC